MLNFENRVTARKMLENDGYEFSPSLGYNTWQKGCETGGAAVIACDEPTDHENEEIIRFEIYHDGLVSDDAPVAIIKLELDDKNFEDDMKKILEAVKFWVK